MPDPSLRNKLNDIELVEYAQKLSRTSSRTLRYVKDDSRTDGAVYEDMTSGDRLFLEVVAASALDVVHDQTHEARTFSRQAFLPGMSLSPASSMTESGQS